MPVNNLGLTDVAEAASKRRNPLEFGCGFPLCRAVPPARWTGHPVSFARENLPRRHVGSDARPG